MTQRFTARGLKSLIRRYLKTHALTEHQRRDFFLELRALSGSVRWTPHLFQTVLRHYASDLDRGAIPAIYLAKDVLKLATFEDAAALICAEAAKDPSCHPLLRGRTTFAIRDYYGEFWQANSPELQRGLVTYVERAVAARLHPRRQLG